MTGFGRFASLLVSSTGASNRTFTTQLSDRRENKNQSGGGARRVCACVCAVSHAGKKKKTATTQRHRVKNDVMGQSAER